MSASIALNNALTGLNVNQQALTVLSQNIANANTPGYSKQTINQAAVSLDGVDAGVSIESITRTVDQYLTTAAQAQNSVAGQATTINNYYSNIQLLLGSPGSQDSIDSYINNFFNSVQALAQTPDNTTLQQSVVSNGVTVATQFNQLSQGLSTLQFQADQDINSSVASINNDLNTIYQLNKTISQQTALGQSVADLQDQRDNLVTDISQYMNVNAVQTTSGALFLNTTNGINLLNDNLYQLQYSPASSADDFSNNAPLSALTVSPVDASGNPTGTPVDLITAGTPSQSTTVLTSGKIAALESMRDQIIPNIMSQIDSVAANLRDQVNTIQNSGSGYPGANSLTGTSPVNAAQTNQWSGQVQIAVLNSNGQPIPSSYADESYGMQPLTLNLATMNTGNGVGNPSVQGIINAINQYYGVPQNKLELSNLNNIQLVSNTTALPNTNNTLNLGFNLNNISGTSSNFYVSNISVTANNANGSTQSVPVASSTIPTIALNPVNTYTTSASNTAVTIATTGGANNLINGQVVYLSTPPAGPDAGNTYGGIAPASLGGYFTVNNVTGTSFQIQANESATSSVVDSVAGQVANPSYATAPTGATTNTSSNGSVNVNLSSDNTATSYTVTATVGVDNGTGNVQTSQVTYQVYNNQPALLGTLYGAQTATGSGKIVSPSSLQPVATATLVNADGVELPKVNGQYVTSQNGYLKLQTASGSTYLAIDSLNSQEMGQTSSNPPGAATNDGFSDYFNLNDFFTTGTSDAVAGSAINLAVQQRLQNNDSLLSLGQLSQGATGVGSNAPPNYTYQLNPGDGSIAANMAALATKPINFPAAGGLGPTSQTFSGYSGQVIGGIATDASTATTNNTNAQSLLDSYNQQNSAISGVNLDTELANTVIYQNAYAASARVITVTTDLFNSLLQAFG